MPVVKKRIGIDLTSLYPGGMNGGVKPLILQTIRVTGRQLRGRANFVFFTNSWTHGEVRDLARPGDEIVCILKYGETEMPVPVLTPVRESIDEYEDPLLLVRHRINVLYCPFGAVHLATPGIPTISCIVDLVHIDYPATISEEEVANRYQYLKKTMTLSDSLNCISLYVVSRVLEHYPEFRGEIFYTYNAVQTRLSEAPVSSRELPCKRYFFFPSNFWVHKNHEVLLIAFRNYLQRSGKEPWHLVLTGAEDERSEAILKLIETLGLSETVHFLGYVDESYLRKLWDNSSALVFPSLHEGFGIPTLEAMHFGKPILASKAPCFPEIGGDACLYFDPRKPLDLANAFLKIQSDDTFRDDLVEKGKMRLKQFDIEPELRKLSNAFLKARPHYQWNKGLFPDGWFGAHALIGIPDTPGRWKLEITVAGRERPTTMAIFVSGRPFGSYSIPDHLPRQIELWVDDPTGTLHFSVGDPAQLSQEDERPLGARIVSISLKNEEFEMVPIFQAQNPG